MKVGLLLLAMFAAPLAAQDSHSHSVDGAPAAVAGPRHASAYAEGLYLLHNFEYERAAEAFRRAQRDDRGNAMAYWGEAMTHNHPLWAYQDRDGGRAVLARLGSTPAARAAKARSPREAAWIEAAEILYGDGDKLERDRAFHAHMMAMHKADPGDVDARSLAALATLGLAHGGRDVALYMRAAALLEEGLADNPAHPGVLHYLIHSYDDPDHAPLGLRAARRYALVAPDAGHAQHMVSHIHLALGDWPAVEATNVQAMKVVNAQRAAAGQAATMCGHFNEWLVYALDQQGRDSSAIVDGCRAEGLAAGSDGTVLGRERSLVNNWALIAVRHGVDTGRWPAPGALAAGNGNLLARFDLAYGRLLAARANSADAARELSELRRIHALAVAAYPQERPDDHATAAWLDRALAQGEAVATLARGDTGAGLALLHAAADAEAALPKPFGPPLLAKPSAELLGDEYLKLGRKADAAQAYRRALAASPGRRLSEAGLRASL